MWKKSKINPYEINGLLPYVNLGCNVMIKRNSKLGNVCAQTDDVKYKKLKHKCMFLFSYLQYVPINKGAIIQ